MRGHADFDDARRVRAVRAGGRRGAGGIAPAAPRLLEERARLRPLPSAPIPSYTSYESKVRRWSTIRVAHRTYSVPARLMGHTVEARVYADVVEVRYRDQVVQTMPRLRKEDEHKIDYRHVIGWLVRKPGAFARYRYREDLFPSVTFRRAYDRLQDTHGDRADIEYLRVLHLAAQVGEATGGRHDHDLARSSRDLRLRRRGGLRRATHGDDPDGAHPAPESARVRCAPDRSRRMTRPHKTDTVGDQITALLTGFGLTTAARELVSRFVEADQAGGVAPAARGAGPRSARAARAPHRPLAPRVEAAARQDVRDA